jgi:hypothetical protein
VFCVRAISFASASRPANHSPAAIDMELTHARPSCPAPTAFVAEVPTYGGRIGQLMSLFPQAVPEAVGDSREDPGHDGEWRFLLGKSSLRCRVRPPDPSSGETLDSRLVEQWTTQLARYRQSILQTPAAVPWSLAVSPSPVCLAATASDHQRPPTAQTPFLPTTPTPPKFSRFFKVFGK